MSFGGCSWSRQTSIVDWMSRPCFLNYQGYRISGRVPSCCFAKMTEIGKGYLSSSAEFWIWSQFTVYWFINTAKMNYLQRGYGLVMPYPEHDIVVLSTILSTATMNYLQRGYGLVMPYPEHDIVVVSTILT